MAWIKIGERDVLNANFVKTIAIQQFRDGAYYIRFGLNGDDSVITKGFEKREECLKLFNRIWCAILEDKSIDISLV